MSEPNGEGAQPWPELHPLPAAGTTAFRLALPRDAPRREGVDPALWELTALASLDLAGVGLRRLDEKAAVGEDPPPSEAPEAAACGVEAGLRRLGKLRDLVLRDNQLGPVLQPDGALHGLSALRSLDLEGNGLETLPAALISLASLTSLNVGRNNLTELPWLSLSLLPELRLLSAPQNRITSLVRDEGSQAASLPPRLTELTLRANLLEGDGGLAPLAACAGLAALDLAENRLTSLPAELAVGCGKLAKLDIGGNAWEDKKLAKLAEAQQEQAPAKPILELLRKGQSRRQLKSELSRRPLPPPPRMYLPSGHPDEESGTSAAQPPEPAVSQKSGKKGKNKAAAGAVQAPAAPATSSQLPRKCVVVTREALSVRPHFLATLLHVVVGEDSAKDQEGKAAEPFVFLAEGCSSGTAAADFESAFESNLGLLERGLDIEAPGADEAARAAQRATGRLREFVAAQTRVHAASDLGDKRRKGALGSHNAAVLRWPLRFAAAPHAGVRFAPLAIGWMESKGLVSAADYARQAAAGRIEGAARDVALALQRPAAALLALPLCPHLLDEEGTVLSVHPLSNGWRSRTTADAKGGLLLECSSAESEATCRRMLLALIRDAIDLIEGGNGVPGLEADTELLRQRRVRVLLEPVDVVCEWDRNLRRAQFPSRDEMLSLPPLPAYCGADAGSAAEGGGC